MNTSCNSKQTTCLCRDTGGKGTLPAQCTGFDTLDNCGHKTPTQSKRKRTGKKRLKGHGPEHVYNTLGYIYIVLLSPFVGGGWDPDGWGPPGCPTHFFSPDISWMGDWVGPTQSIGWSCFALISIRRQQFRVNQGIEVNFCFFITWVYYALSPGARLHTCVHPLVRIGGGWGQSVMKQTKHNMASKNQKQMTKGPRFGHGLWEWTLLQHKYKLPKVSGHGVVEWQPPTQQTVTICDPEGFPGNSWDP